MSCASGCIWLALGASDPYWGIDNLLVQVVRGFALGAQAHHAYVFANQRANRLKVLVFGGSAYGCTPGACSRAALRGCGKMPAH